MDYTEVRHTVYLPFVVVTAGANTLNIKLPASVEGELDVRDISISLMNSTGARGEVAVYLYDSEASIPKEVYLHQLQTALHFIHYAQSGIITTSEGSHVLVASFSNCVVADDLDFIVSYTIRRYY